MTEYINPKRVTSTGSDFVTGLKSHAEAGVCEGCEATLTPLEVLLCKYPVCGKCVRKRHLEAVGDKLR